jgi:hypothetical protein
VDRIGSEEFLSILNILVDILINGYNEYYTKSVLIFKVIILGDPHLYEI